MKKFWLVTMLLWSPIAMADIAGHSAKALVAEAFASRPASIDSQKRSGRLTTELCFDRCYRIDGDASHANEYWDAVVLFMATIGKWNVPEQYKEAMSTAAAGIVRDRPLRHCASSANPTSCTAIVLVAAARVSAWEVNYDEGNKCTTRVDVKRSLEAMNAIVAKTSQCSKVPK